MPHEITEFRKDDDTYHVVLTKTTPKKGETGLATAIATDDALEAMPEGEKLNELLKRAKKQLKIEDEDVPQTTKAQGRGPVSKRPAGKRKAKKPAPPRPSVDSVRKASRSSRKPAS